MKAAFVIAVGYASLGFLYAPGAPSLLALGFIALSSLPWLLMAHMEPFEPRLEIPATSAVLYWTFLALGIANLGIVVWRAGVAPTEMLSLEGFLAVATASTEARYADFPDNSGSPLIMAASLFAMFWAGAAGRRQPVWRHILLFVPMALYAVLSTEKWPLFLSGAFFVAGIVTGNPYPEARRILAKVLLSFLLVGTPVGMLSMVLRGTEGGATDLILGLLHYLFAPYTAFGDWLVSRSFADCCGFGAVSLVGPASALGLVLRIPGVFSDQATVYGLDTNIFTAWRYLVQDYTVVGPVALTSLGAAFYYAALLDSRFGLAAALKSLFVICALLSLSVTPFVHNATALASLSAMVFTAYHASTARLGEGAAIAPDTSRP
jgi:hypothetical protein